MSEIYGRYKNARDSAWQVLIDYKINSLPVKISSIAVSAGINIIKNSTVHQLRDNEVGKSVLYNEQWFIIYDDLTSYYRIRFTIAHELGHIFLGHPLITGYHARTVDTSKPVAETEADIFASRLLAPACVLWGLNIHSPEDISRICGISYTAAKIRAKRMDILYTRNKFLTSPLEKQLYKQFENFINNYKK